MKLTKKLMIATLSLPLFLGSVAYADGSHGEKEHHGKKGPMACEDDMSLMRQLNLSDEQKNEMKAMRSAGREEMKANFEKHGEAMMKERKAQQEQMQKIVMADKFDKGAAEKLAQKMSEKHTEMLVNKLEREHKLINILTPEQKAEYAKLKQEQDCKGDGERGHGKKSPDMKQDRS